MDKQREQLFRRMRQELPSRWAILVSDTTLDMLAVELGYLDKLGNGEGVRRVSGIGLAFISAVTDPKKKK